MPQPRPGPSLFLPRNRSPAKIKITVTCQWVPMSSQTEVAQFPAAAPPSRFTRAVLGRFAKQFEHSPVSFSVTLPDGSVQPFGPAAARFNITLRNSRALKAVASLDEGRFGDAYVNGDIDLDGDMLSPFELRGSMKDVHPITTVWRFLQPLLFGQVHTNKQAITAHYDIDPEFFLSFLDPATPCYTQGVYHDASETLEAATLRKFDYCFQQCGLKA